MKQIIEKINSERQSVKAYDTTKSISKPDWNMIMETIRWSPSSMGFEPYRVIVVKRDNTKLRSALKPLMFNQGPATEADKLLFFVTPDSATINTMEYHDAQETRTLVGIQGLKGADLKKGIEGSRAMYQSFMKMCYPDGNTLPWAQKQAYIALGMAMSAAAILSIGSTAMEGFHPEGVAKLFRDNKLMKAHEQVAVVLALGYPTSSTAYQHRGSGKRVRYSLAEKFTEV